MIPQMEPTYGEEEKKAISEYLDSGGWLMEFKKTREFEESLCNYTKSRFCSVLPNGTITLFAALRALEIGPGDEVIVPNYTMIASPNAVILTGARPVFVDIDETSFCINPDEARKKITARTKGIMHVSINGRAGRLLELKKLCEDKRIYLIEDAAQSLGSFFQGKHLGTYGLIGSFSFSAPKIITTGQGGALITDSEELHKKILKIKDFGRIKAGVDIHDQIGWNFKFTDLQAVIGIEQMKKLDYRVKRKKEMQILYKNCLSGCHGAVIVNSPDETSPWFFELLAEKKEELKAYLESKGIGTRSFYPPISSQVIYKTSEHYPVTEKITSKGLWLPSSIKLKDEDIDMICTEIKRFYV